MEFNRVIPTTDAIYSVSYISDVALNPASVVKENFCVYDESLNLDAEVLEAVYLPIEKMVVLRIMPEYTYNYLYTVTPKSDVKAFDGAFVEKSLVSDMKIGYNSNVDGVSVIDSAVYDEDFRILNPEGKIRIAVCAQILNKKTYQQQCELSIYLNEDKLNPIFKTDILLEPETVSKFTFDIITREYAKNDTLGISIN